MISPGQAQDLETYGFCHGLVPYQRVSRSPKHIVSDDLGFRQIGATRVLRPTRASDAIKNSMSACFGLGEQPFHTDCATWPVPPRMILFEFLTDSAVSTKVLSFSQTEKNLRELRSLGEQVWLYQAPNFKGLYGSVFQTEGEQFKFRFDRMAMPENPKGAERVEEALKAIGKTTYVASQRGKWLLIDNQRCLHARTTVPQCSLTRKVARSYWG